MTDKPDKKESKDTRKMDSKLSDLNISITNISQEINKLYDERKSLNLMSLAMSNDLENIKGLPEEQQKILVEVQKRQEEANELRRMRDEINSNIILPEQAILENLYLYYYRLTGEESDLRYPSLKKEAEMFSRFLELQKMFIQKVKSTEYHIAFQGLMNEQFSTIDELNKIRKKSGKSEINVSKKIDSKNPIGFKIFKINKKIASNKRKMNQLKKERSKLESKLGRKGHRKKKYNVPNLSSIQDRISEGGSLSLDDLGALLKHGKGIQEIEETVQKRKNAKKQIKNAPKRRIQTSRGRRRAGPRDTSLKQDR
ncbi:MAG: hypothetical protein CMA03_05450 [Euryarchaeota archaeon]|nr:hypothetical protein [Euryarchaeota archaeon]